MDSQNKELELFMNQFMYFLFFLFFICCQKKERKPVSLEPLISYFSEKEVLPNMDDVENQN